MNTTNKTLWLGNIESWMDSYYIKETLKQIGIFPIKITIKVKNGKRGCAFLEFDSYETALKILNKYNGIIYKKITIKLNWVRNYDRLNLIKPLFVGNIDKTITNDELKNYFLNLYTSIISVKIIFDQVTGRSKGFGFIEFTNYREFNKALNNKNPVILGKQKLVFNSGKNKYDDFNESDSLIVNNNINHSDSTNSFNLTQQSTETGTSVFNSMNNSNRNSISNSFIEDNLNNNKPNIKSLYNRNEDEQFRNEISNAFKNISEMAFFTGKNELNQYNYYCNNYINKNNFENNFNEDFYSKREFPRFNTSNNYNKFEISQLYNKKI